jgi:hypothetical protein
MSDLLTVKAQVDETDIAQIRLRQPAHIALDAYPDRPFAGRVDQIAYDAKTVNNVTTYEVDVLREKHHPSCVAATANVSFVADCDRMCCWYQAKQSSRAAIIICITAVDSSNDAPTEREIKTGLSDGKRTEVRKEWRWRETAGPACQYRLAHRCGFESTHAIRQEEEVIRNGDDRTHKSNGACAPHPFCLVACGDD